jgi:hypothetical protein
MDNRFYGLAAIIDTSGSALWRPLRLHALCYLPELAVAAQPTDGIDAGSPIRGMVTVLPRTSHVIWPAGGAAEYPDFTERTWAVSSVAGGPAAVSKPRRARRFVRASCRHGAR